jgi:hypothetical protein
MTSTGLQLPRPRASIGIGHPAPVLKRLGIRRCSDETRAGSSPCHVAYVAFVISMTERDTEMWRVDQELLAERFEEHRLHLRAVAYRMLGSLGLSVRTTALLGLEKTVGMYQGNPKVSS